MRKPSPYRKLGRPEEPSETAVTRRHRKLKQLLVDEAGGGCAVCGYARCHGNLHFHHVEPSEKSFEIQMGLGKSLAAYSEEARKCVLVCANCHGEIEAGLIPSPPAGSKLHDRELSGGEQASAAHA